MLELEIDGLTNITEPIPANNSGFKSLSHYIKVIIESDCLLVNATLTLVVSGH